MIAPGVLSPAHCARLIERFESSDGIEPCQRENGHSFSQLDITRAWPDEKDALLQVFLAHLTDYQKKTRARFWPPDVAYEHLRLKRYLPNGRDFFPPHVDVMDQVSARRFMTAMI